MTRLFGTDGIRAAFGTPPLDETTVRRLAAALAHELEQNCGATSKVVLGGDTRDSTPILCRWLTEVLTAHGAEITYLGVIPTPGVAAVVRARNATCGVAVSASHNAHPDNGLKLIDSTGFKWAREAEQRLEARLDTLAENPETPRRTGGLDVDRGAVDEYLHRLEKLAAPLDGLRLVVDAAQGAASPYAGPLFERLGADVEVLYANPDGRNINAGCGSTHPEVAAHRTGESEADLGLAFDGDADRVLMIDEAGKVRDGDAILYLWARELKSHGRLPGNRIVATSMSNLGLENALSGHGISVVRCDVGDRAVVRTMRDSGIVLGGEQSGHIVNLELGTQGDGLLTALSVASLVHRATRPLSELLDGFERYPQRLENVRVRSKPDLETLPRVRAVRDAVVERLGKDGRLVLRYSGTEPLARVMIEGRDLAQVEALTSELAAVIAEELS